ncbi:MAG: histidine kinase [Bacteroidota bacterium]
MKPYTGVMAKLDRWIDNKVVQNLFVWFLLFLILLITIQGTSRIGTASFTILLLAPAVYINNIYILPFFRKKTFLFFGLFVLNALVFTAVSVFTIALVTEWKLEPKMFVNFFGVMILTLLFASSLKMARDSFFRRQQEKEAELKLLKAQLNPHFLFNTLNNLYGLSVVKSDNLPQLMLKLSDLLRYSLYETKETYVPLEKEVTYLENYMSLEQIRLEDDTQIKFIKEGDLSSWQIAPMLLIVFVENAFKHLEAFQENKKEVAVRLGVKEDILSFSCENSIDTKGLTSENIEKGRSGIGLENVKKRLNLLYPDSHSLTIDKGQEAFSVQLTLKL